MTKKLTISNKAYKKLKEFKDREGKTFDEALRFLFGIRNDR